MSKEKTTSMADRIRAVKVTLEVPLGADGKPVGMYFQVRPALDGMEPAMVTASQLIEKPVLTLKSFPGLAIHTNADKDVMEYIEKTDQAKLISILNKGK